MRYEINVQTGERVELPDLPSTAPTAAQIIASFETALDAHLDATARQHRYNDRFTFALRAGYSGPYQAEATVFAQWMDECNAQAYSLMRDVQLGIKPMPESVESFVADLPEFKA